VTARATVRTGQTQSAVEFNRDELVSSTISAISRLKNFKQRRVSLDAAWAAGETEATCKRITLTSTTIEQGQMNGKPYRFEAVEDYTLEKRDGEWLAVAANTRQR